MAKFQVNKSIQEINEKIKSGQAVVVTAEEMIDIVKKTPTDWRSRSSPVPIVLGLLVSAKPFRGVPLKRNGGHALFQGTTQ